MTIEGQTHTITYIGKYNVEKIGEYKKDNNVTTYQVKRWDDIMKNRSDLAKKMNLNTEFVVEIYKIIHEESIRRQTEIMKAVEEP